MGGPEGLGAYAHRSHRSAHKKQRFRAAIGDIWVILTLQTPKVEVGLNLDVLGELDACRPQLIGCLDDSDACCRKVGQHSGWGRRRWACLIY